jgi:hypothetical protein
MGAGASAAIEAVAGASSDEIRAALDQVSPADLAKIQNAVKQHSDAGVRENVVTQKSDASITDMAELQQSELMEMSTQGSDSGIPDKAVNEESDVSVLDMAEQKQSRKLSTQISNCSIPDTSVKEKSDDGVPGMAELEQLDFMEMSTHETWAAWAERTLLQNLEDTLKNKIAGEEVVLGMEVYQQLSWLDDTIRLLLQYLDADESTNPKPWKTADDKERLQKLTESLKRSAEKANEIIRQIVPAEDEGEVSGEGY